jgi:SAM-dependent methyltransferase
MNQEKIWEYFQGEGVGVFSGSAARLDYLFRSAERLFGRRKLRVLNIGIGNGWLERRCLERGWETCALDPSEHAVGTLAAEGVKGKAGFIDDIPFPDGGFDVVFCSEVLEHLSADTLRTGLQEIRRVLTEDGVLIGTVPYKEDLKNNMAVCPDCGKVFHRWGHLQVFDKQILLDVLGVAGWKIISMRTRSFLDLSGLNSLGKAKASLHLMLGWMGVAIATPSLFFQARKSTSVSGI